MNTCALTAVVLFSFLGQANPAPGLEAVARLATEARDAAVAALPRAKGQGRYEYTIKKSADGETTFERKGDYSFAFSEEKNWGKFVKSLERDYDATVYVSDAENLWVAHFDDEISPGGGHGLISNLIHPGVLPPALFVTPQAAASGWTFFQVGEDGCGENCVATLEMAGSQYVIQKKKKSYVQRLYIDPNKGFHLVRYESRELDGRVTRIVTKNWATTTDGVWYVQEYHAQEFPIRARTHYVSSKIILDSIEPNINIPPEVFTVAALGLPDVAWVKDIRVKPNQRIRFLQLKADMAAFGRVLREGPDSKKD
jgi:hypothetical protein